MANFDIGDRIKHKVFGEGDVQAIDGSGDSANLTILFDDIDDSKLIKASYVKLARNYSDKQK